MQHQILQVFSGVVASRLADAATADGRPWRVLVLEATRREKEIHAQLQ